MPIKEIWDRIAVLQEGQPLAAFCRCVGLNYQTMRKCSQRGAAPDTVSLAKIAQHFRADLRWLITGENPSGTMNLKIGKKLKELRKKQNLSLGKLGEILSIHKQTLEFYEKGAWSVPWDLLHEFANKLGVAPHEFFMENNAQSVQIPELNIFQTSSAKNAPKISQEDYVSIPLTDSAIAAGQPIIQEENIEDYVLLHVRAAGKSSNLVASRVDGTSMEPMLHSGDIVVVDRNEKILVKGRIFAVYYEGGLTAKYLERQKSLLILRPLNPISEVQIINLNEQPDPVVGRIIGAWKEL